MPAKNVGFFGSCQLEVPSSFFFNDIVMQKYDINVKFKLPFFIYDTSYPDYRGQKLDYSIFDDLDFLVIEINKLDNDASSEKIINYLKNKNVKIIRTFLIKFPIYPINWSGYGENKIDYINWKGLDNIDYNEKFENCIESMRKNNIECDLSQEITDFVEQNFNKHLLFTHSLHPTNILLYQIWKQILNHMSINIEENNYIFKKQLLLCWYNPLTTKMIKDLDIRFKNMAITDKFYIERYNKNKDMFCNMNTDIF